MRDRFSNRLGFILISAGLSLIHILVRSYVLQEHILRTVMMKKLVNKTIAVN